MGRKLMRVPLDFDWPIGCEWETDKYSGCYKEPPLGKGYQLWKTTTEVCPLSPVFEMLEALCKWCESGATVFANKRISKEAWIKILSNNKTLMNYY